MQSNAPETKPCPECGGLRVFYENVGPELRTFGFSLKASKGVKAWNDPSNEGQFNMIRCMQCGYCAFFWVKRGES